jgi:hypothetical protein
VRSTGEGSGGILTLCELFCKGDFWILAGSTGVLGGGDEELSGELRVTSKGCEVRHEFRRWIT